MKQSSTWYTVFTAIGGIGAAGKFGLTTSADLQNWTNFTYVTAPGVSNSVYAPEWVKNPDGTLYLDGGGCPHVFYTNTNQTTSFVANEIHPTVCNDFTQPWSTPVAITVTGSSGRVLDPMVVCVSPGGGTCNGTGDTFRLLFTDIVTLSVSQFVHYASSSTLTGTYTLVSTSGNWLNGGANQEGPMAILVAANHWRIYFDKIPAPPGEIVLGQINYVDSFDDWANWTNPTPINTDSIQAKHGTVIPYP